MHGKRRRKSSYTPFKHKEGNIEAHNYMAEDKYHRATTQEADNTRVDTPTINQIQIDDDLKQVYKDMRQKDEEKDSLVENLVEIVDPTGFSSWNDAARAYNKEEWGLDEYLDMASVIPFTNKFTKLFKAARGGINLAKAGFSASKAAKQGLEGYEAASDIYQDNIKGGVGGGGKKKSKSRSSGWSYYGGIK